MFRAVWLWPAANVCAMLLTCVGIAVPREGGGRGAFWGSILHVFPKEHSTECFLFGSTFGGCFLDVFLSFLSVLHAQVYRYSP